MQTLPRIRPNKKHLDCFVDGVNVRTRIGESKCAFESGVFDDDNWNCMTISSIRTLSNEQFYVNPPAKISYTNDQTCMMLPFDGKFIILGWYKMRGRVESAIVVDETFHPGLTLEITEACIEYWRKLAPVERK